MFVHLRGRGTYSMLEGIGSLNEIFQKSKSLGQTSIALTDLYGLYGVVDFYSKSKNFEMKPLIGIEIPYTSHIASFQITKGISHLPTITLLVHNAEGYHNLLRIVSAGYEHCIDDKPLIDSEILKSFSSGLFVLIGGLGSYVYQSLSTYNDPERAENHIEEIVSIMTTDYTIIDITAQLYTDYPHLKVSNDFLIQEAINRKIITVTSSGYLYPESIQKGAYETALAIKDGKKIYDLDARKILGSHHILSEQEIRDILEKNGFSEGDIVNLVDATVEVADRCQTKIALGQSLFPNYDTPLEMRELYALYKDGLMIE